MEIMIKIVKACLLTSFVSLLLSCQKDKGMIDTVEIAKVNVINAVVSDGNVKANVGIKHLWWNSIDDKQIIGGEGHALGRLYTVPTDMPTYLQVTPVNDTTKVWYNNKQQLVTGKIYTLYLSGTPANIKTSFHEENNFPKYILRDAGRPIPVTDSIINIRFVNLSPSGPKVDVNIQGKSVNEVSDLSYEEFSEFKSYPFTKNANFISFEIRQSSDKQLVANYALYIPTVRFKSIAIVMMGIYPGFTVPYMDQYRADIVVYQ